MKRKTILLSVCLCSLLLCACNNNNNQSNDVQAGEAQNEATQQPQSSLQTEEALSIALEHAGVQKDKITAQRIKKEREDGQDIYDVEFHVGNTEYDYEIRMNDGKIIKFDSDIDND